MKGLCLVLAIVAGMTPQPVNASEVGASSASSISIQVSVSPVYRVQALDTAGRVCIQTNAKGHFEAELAEGTSIPRCHSGAVTISSEHAGLERLVLVVPE